jgi:hypothetical protein
MYAYRRVTYLFGFLRPVSVRLFSRLMNPRFWPVSGEGEGEGVELERVEVGTGMIVESKMRQSCATLFIPHKYSCSTTKKRN